MKIPLGATRRCKHTGKYEALVSLADFEWASEFNWTADVHRGGKRVYAVRRAKDDQGRSRKVYLHREVWFRAHGSIPTGMMIDHIVTDEAVHGLDNRRSSLRLADFTGNAANQSRRRDNTSGFKGVSWNAHLGKFEAYINHLGKRTKLGLFIVASDAARAYNEAAKVRFGQFARLNSGVANG